MRELRIDLNLAGIDTCYDYSPSDCRRQRAEHHAGRIHTGKSYVRILREEPGGKKRRDERMKALREGLLRPDENVRSSVEARKAISYCEYCILEYEESFELNEAKWLQWQTVVIVGGVVATLAGVATIPGSWAVAPYLEGFGWLRGVPQVLLQ